MKRKTLFYFLKETMKIFIFTLSILKKEIKTKFIFETISIIEKEKMKQFNIQKINGFSYIYIAKARNIKQIKKLGNIKWAVKETRKKIIGRCYETKEYKETNKKKLLNIEDPLFSYQWYLNNKMIEGNDINVIPVWLSGNYGKGVHVCIIDDGIEYDHEDLKESFDEKRSYDFNENKKDIHPRNSDKKHGTRCAGQIVSSFNDVCGVGIAPKATFSGIKILSPNLSNIEEAKAFVYQSKKTDIYSCSWGPLDDGKTIEGPDALALRSIIEGVLKGREGLGSVYLFAVGNGKHTDNCNYDGYVNNVFTIGIGAIDFRNEIPSYVEKCASHLAVTYSSNKEKGIATTDRNGKCTKTHGGTSAAVPIASGILALVFSENKKLSWRDVFYLIVETASPVCLEDGEWEINGYGKSFSHWLGFGKIDTDKIVSKAKNWKQVGPLLPKPLPIQNEKKEIEYGSTQNCFSYFVSKWMVEDLFFLEQITISLFIKYTKRGSLFITLESPSGMVSKLATYRPNDISNKDLKWTFSSVAFWGEQIEGTWKMCIENNVSSEEKGSLIYWRITFWGQTTEERLESYTEKLDYQLLLLFPYYPPTEEYFSEFSPYYHHKQFETKKIEKKIIKNRMNKDLFFIIFFLLILVIGLYKRIRKNRRNETNFIILN